MDAAFDALGVGQLTSISSATLVNTVTGGIPAGTQVVVLQPETQNVRYRDDGTSPTTAIGLILVANTMYEFTISQIARMSVIEVAATAKLNIAFYGTRTGTVS